jgi:hypothetical protein
MRRHRVVGVVIRKMGCAASTLAIEDSPVPTASTMDDSINTAAAVSLHLPPAAVNPLLSLEPEIPLTYERRRRSEQHQHRDGRPPMHPSVRSPPIRNGTPATPRTPATPGCPSTPTKRRSPRISRGHDSPNNREDYRQQFEAIGSLLDDRLAEWYGAPSATRDPLARTH